MIYKNKLNYKL